MIGNVEEQDAASDDYWQCRRRQNDPAPAVCRIGVPPDCDLRDLTKIVLDTLWRVHEELRVKLVELVEKYQSSKEVIWIRSSEELGSFLAGL